MKRCSSLVWFTVDCNISEPRHLEDHVRASVTDPASFIQISLRLRACGLLIQYTGSRQGLPKYSLQTEGDLVHHVPHPMLLFLLSPNDRHYIYIAIFTRFVSTLSSTYHFPRISWLGARNRPLMHSSQRSTIDRSEQAKRRQVSRLRAGTIRSTH